MASELTRRIFHPKGTAYGYHANAFLAAIKANRDPAVTGTCQGNQVLGNCTSSSYGNAANFTGEQSPSCFKANGSSDEIYYRLNTSIATTAANQYCTELVANHTVLQSGASQPEPYIVKGAGENGTDLMLSVLYDEAACPADKSNTTLDFSTYTEAACGYNLIVPFTTECVQDSTWGDYHKNYTLMGGVFMDACALWVAQGVAPENDKLVIPTSLPSLQTSTTGVTSATATY